MLLARSFLAAFSAAALLCSAADAKTFRYSTTGDILGLDPHMNNEGPTNAMKDNVYGRLIHRLADLSLEPDLATSWEQSRRDHLALQSARGRDLPQRQPVQRR